MKYLYPNGKRKALTFSFDDGQIFDIRLAKLFRDHGMKCTFNLNSGTLADEDDAFFVNKNKLGEIYEGHEIAVHGVEHLALPSITDQEIVNELMLDRQNLEKLTGKIIDGMAYAFGAYDERSMKLARAVGIKYSRTVGENPYFDIPSDFMKWDSTVHQSHNLIEKGEEFLNVPDWKALPLMYVWGHSFEFGNSGDWTGIESFVELMEGKDDIWYATNGEIYDYVTAMKRLEFSADGKVAKNPTSYEIWYTGRDNKVYSVKAGETAVIK